MTIQQLSLIKDHTPIKCIEDLRNMFPDSFDRMGNMQDEYSNTLDPNVPPVQHGRHRVPKEAKEEIKDQLKDMTTQDITP